MENAGKRGRRWWPPGWKYILLAVLLLLISGLGGAYHYSSSPQFCRSCHIMEPYYKAWAGSKHNFVPCVQCHYPPGERDALRVKFQALAQVAKFITRTYSSKPFAEVEDASCLRSNCHATRLLEGKLLYKGFVKFDHKEHLSERRAGKKLRCTSCHSQIVVGTHMVVTETTCFLCHFNRGVRDARHLQPLAGCDRCHTPPDRPIKLGDITYNHKDFVGTRNVVCQSCHIDTIQGTGEAPRERCFDCHNKPEHLARYKDTPWLHDQHVSGKNIECVRCHKPIEHKIQRVSATMPHQVNCQACHQAEHDLQQLMYLGTGGLGVPDSPSPMFLARVDCIACHIKPREANGGSTLFQATEEACLACHPADYRGMVREWKETIRRAVDEFRPKARAAGAALNNAGDNPYRFYAEVLYNDVQHNLKMVTQGNPIHNIYYAARLLQAANERVDQMAEALSFTPPEIGRNSLISGTFCLTLCHNRVGVKLPERVSWNGIRIPHTRHSETLKLGCANCHEFGHHKEVTVKIKREECLSCHHQALKKMPQIPCEGCHRRQAAFRKGQSLGEEKPTKAPMTALPCKACHAKIDQGHREADVRASCATCHKPFYEKILDAWKQQVAGPRGKVEAGLKKLRSLLEQIRKPSYEKILDSWKQRGAGPRGKAEAGLEKLRSRLGQIQTSVGHGLDERTRARRRAGAKLGEAEKLLEAVAFDQSGGVHNVPYAVGLLGRAEAALKEAEDLLSPRAPAPAGTPSR